MNKIDINKTIPFLCVKALRNIAINSVGEQNILDISQGEPGYGFSPSVRSRRLASFFMLLDTKLNNHSKNIFFSKKTESELDKINEIIKKTAYDSFNEQYAKIILNDWRYFIDELKKISDNQGLNFSEFDILQELFKYSNLTGGRYPQPNGHVLLNATFAQKFGLDEEAKHENIITTLGASHAIGTVFKALGDEGIGFLSEGDSIVMTTPVYSPYLSLFEERSINIESVYVDIENGQINQNDIDRLKKSKKRIKCIVLIVPNNPTGFAPNEKFIKSIIELAEVHNSIIVTDEVYSKFFDKVVKISDYENGKKRLILIDAISKVEIATGVRSGFIYLSDVANNFISTNILNKFLSKYRDLFELLRLSKSPTGMNIGLFQHITGIPGPSVLLSLTHIILGEEEQKEYKIILKNKTKTFYNELNLPYRGNLYYGIINLSNIESEKSKKRKIETLLEDFAKKGVVFMPANLFFDKNLRKKMDTTRMIRVSFPNLSTEEIKKVTKIIKETCVI